MDISYEDAIIAVVRELSQEQQRRVLEFAQGIKRPKGESGEEFLRRTENIHIPPEDLEAMKHAIEEEFERIDWDEWDLPS